MGKLHTLGIFVWGGVNRLGRCAVNGILPVLAIAGLAVGIGTALGSGCTSGHGICGISRFSVRSIGATVTFVATGMVTVFVIGLA